jgi:hypothetical protein
VDISIRLKKLQVVSGVLRKGNEGLRIVFSFLNGFFFVRRGGWVIPPLYKRGFFKGIGRDEFFMGWGLTERFGFLGDMGMINLVVSQGRKVELFVILPGIIFWVVWDGKRGWVYIFFLFSFFFCDMVT